MFEDYKNLISILHSETNYDVNLKKMSGADLLKVVLNKFKDEETDLENPESLNNYYEELSVIKEISSEQQSPNVKKLDDMVTMFASNIVNEEKSSAAGDTQFLFYKMFHNSWKNEPIEPFFKDGSSA